VYEPSFLKTMLSLLEARPNAFIAHCRVRTIDASGKLIYSPAERYKERFWPRDNPYERVQAEELRVLRRGNYILMPSVIYRTDAVRQIGPFDESLRFVPDWQYWFRGLLAGYSIVGTHQRLVRYRRHERMASRQLESDLTRYREELSVAAWIAAEGHQRGILPTSRPNHSMTVNVLLSEITRRLAVGDTEGARLRLQFATENIPAFSGPFAGRMARAAARFGRPIGYLGQAAERMLLAWGVGSIT
jgi:hypothetical protein